MEPEAPHEVVEENDTDKDTETWMATQEDKRKDNAREDDAGDDQ